jgi:hypothetical protein
MEHLYYHCRRCVWRATDSRIALVSSRHALAKPQCRRRRRQFVSRLHLSESLFPHLDCTFVAGPFDLRTTTPVKVTDGEIGIAEAAAAAAMKVKLSAGLIF